MGATKHLSIAETAGPGSVVICGFFLVNGNDAPVSVAGNRFTVSAPVAGAYNITLTDGPPAGVTACIVSLAPLDPASTARAFASGGSVVFLDQTGVLEIVTQSSDGTAANLAANTALVSFILVTQKAR